MDPVFLTIKAITVMLLINILSYGRACMGLVVIEALMWLLKRGWDLCMMISDDLCYHALLFIYISECSDHISMCLA